MTFVGPRSYKNFGLMRRRVALFYGLFALVACLAVLAIRLVGDRDALWKIVNGKCMPHWASAQDPSPCTLVDLSGGERRGVAIFKDRVGIAQFLAIPTARISGTESVILQGSEAPDLFGAAWRARRFMWERLGKSLPRDSIGLAINSAFRRSQDQAHIHIDCLRPDIRAVLAKRAGKFRDQLSDQPLILDGIPYDAIWVGEPDLSGVNPFDLAVKFGVEMSRATIAVVGAGADDDQPGFIILVGSFDEQHPNYGHGEDLLDHTCRLADSNSTG